MKKRSFFRVFLFIVFLGLVVIAVLTYGSVTSTDCRAVVLGGKGTVEDPLRIQLEGDCGFTPYIDALLPFRAIPAIELSYKDQKFNIPGLNKYFQNRPVKKEEPHPTAPKAE